MKRTGSDSRFDNTDYLAKVEQDTMAGLEAMLSKETAQKGVKEESKGEPKMKRCGSDTRFDNTAYLAKQESKMISGLMEAMGLEASQKEELLAEIAAEK